MSIFLAFIVGVVAGVVAVYMTFLKIIGVRR